MKQALFSVGDRTEVCDLFEVDRRKAKLALRLCGGYNCNSTAIRLPFDCQSTAIRRANVGLHYGLLYRGLNKSIGQHDCRQRVSGECYVIMTLMTFDKKLDGRRKAVESYHHHHRR